MVDQAIEGHRTCLMDGTWFPMHEPDAPELQAYFTQSDPPQPACGFPVCSKLVRLDWHTAMRLNFIPAPLNTGEGDPVPKTFPSMLAGDIARADGDFGTFRQVALLQALETGATKPMEAAIRFQIQRV